ncbi:Hypothetical protein R9X50_00667400 [Acrodontium crateriforme]|uniref:gamma-glutamylcyclotransferase n=1 Tax=Acrodontium crateriforme TaxID=150365 RepID=A0AAQ3MC17_9PEZI|nr:Hypothetical protein R9X50_00667400 [Acrodontium crateriforme]
MANNQHQDEPAASGPAAICVQRAYHSIMSKRRQAPNSGTTSRTPSTSLTRIAVAEAESERLDPLHPSEFKPDSSKTVLYLAYGSNLCKKTFQGTRGIKPLSQINVQVPSLRLTFDLPGIAYTEPCFANSGTRDPDHDTPSARQPVEETPLLSEPKRGPYRKDAWHKGLIGVVYEVTSEDYAHIIATEGGGSSYQDVLVDCYPFSDSNPRATVPQTPESKPFKAHTLFAPSVPPGTEPPKRGGRIQRPDTSYAQPSARYLNLIKDGAAELDLPYEYQDYLHSLRPYRMTTIKQRIGQVTFMAMWAPPILFIIFVLSKLFADKNGRQPKWLRDLSGAIFKAAWASYDVFFSKVFGDGERTITDRNEGEKLDQSRETRSDANVEKGVS